MPTEPAIGSVLPWPEFGAPVQGSLLATWTANHRHVSAYGSARSALAGLFAFRGIQRVWLPAYSCPALADAAAACERHWYGIDATLAPELQTLSRSLRPGDAVLVIDYFGRPAGPQVAALAASHPEVLWVEDRSQAMDPAAGVLGGVVLYSPRKLVGVAEGGLLVADTALPAPAGPPTQRSARAQRARAEDPDGLHAESWFAAFRAQEAAFAVDDGPMDQSTQAALAGVRAAPLADRRRANAAILADRLADLALWPDLAWDFTPMAFPIRVRDAAALAAGLAASGLYCARHWPTLPSDPALFPLAHQLCGELLSLPCDHRYGTADMLRIAGAVRACGPV